MDINSIELLEFERIRDECSNLCMGPEGKSLLAEQSFETDYDELDHLLSMVSDFRTILTRADDFPASGYPDVSFLPVLEKEGMVLDGEQLAALGTIIRRGEKIKESIITWHSNLSRLSGLLSERAEGIPDLKCIAEMIFRELDESGAVRDDHPALKKIRSRLRNLHTQLVSASGAVMKADPSIWQMEGPVLREGRTVLPLKADYRGKIKGIIHETSSSGNTIYIEPFDMVELNNEKAVQESAYKNAIHAIVRDISKGIRHYYDDIVRFVQVLGYLDTLYARARYGMIHDCARAYSSDGDIILLKARHPHLGNSAVPIEVHLTGDTRVMIITGPNAGGKTVTLKTVGLLAMMNQFGLEIPAAEGSELPVFDDIYADIGDDQSISASLSTFSGHMKRIAAVLRFSTERSLVLLDELGAGTDPSEGSALAMSLLDTFLDIGSTVVVTTHHGIIKQFAYTRSRVMNASLAFDKDTLRPTYRVIEGLPGESHALDIAVSSGITEDLAERARELLDERKSDVSAAVEELEKRKRRLMTGEQELERKEFELREKQRDQNLAALRLKQREKELLQRERAETNRFLRESRKKLENLVREIREGELSKSKIKKSKDFINLLEQHAGEEERKIQEIRESEAETADYQPSAGDEVVVSGKPGTVLRQEKDGRWLVRVGSLRMSVQTSDMKPVVSGGDKKRVSVSYASTVDTSHAGYELDLRGMRLEEALLQLEKQIDSALLAGMTVFHVIHGSGEGILRRGVREYLKECPMVQDFEFSHPREGGFGKTIVRLKQS